MKRIVRKFGEERWEGEGKGEKEETLTSHPINPPTMRSKETKRKKKQINSKPTGIAACRQNS